MRVEEYLNRYKDMQSQALCLEKLETLYLKKGEGLRARAFGQKKAELLRRLREHDRRLRHRLQALPDAQERTALTLKYLEGLTIAEMADAMGYCERQIGKILQRAIAHLEYELLEG